MSWEHKPAAAAELRFDPSDETGVIEGYAARWNTPDSFGDWITKGAFAATIADGRTVPMLWGHDPMQPIGLWSELREDDIGLRVRGRLILDVARAREVRALLAASAIDSLSIGFKTRSAERRPGGGRTVRAVELVEISVVTRGAQPLARLTSVRAAPAAPDAAGIAATIRAATARIAKRKA